MLYFLEDFFRFNSSLIVLFLVSNFSRSLKSLLKVFTSKVTVCLTPILTQQHSQNLGFCITTIWLSTSKTLSLTEVLDFSNQPAPYLPFSPFHLPHHPNMIPMSLWILNIYIHFQNMNIPKASERLGIFLKYFKVPTLQHSYIKCLALQLVLKTAIPFICI